MQGAASILVIFRHVFRREISVLSLIRWRLIAIASNLLWSSTVTKLIVPKKMRKENEYWLTFSPHTISTDKLKRIIVSSKSNSIYLRDGFYS